MKGRGASKNPVNRFRDEETIHDQEDYYSGCNTKEIFDDSDSIITYNASPDVGFNAGINPYRGCEHGCAYCYARPYHEYLGFSSGLDFESKIIIKKKAASLLRKELSSPRYKPQTIAMSGVTDVYQPLERKHRITRECLEVLLEFRNPVSVITKNYLVTRDIDLLRELASFQASRVTLSITTLNSTLARSLEPRTSSPVRRLMAIEKMANAGIPVGVNIAPVIPGLTDFEIPQILEAASNAGASHANYIMLRLPYKVKDIFADWLEEWEPQKSEKVLNRIKSTRNGKLNSTNWGDRFRGNGEFSNQIRAQFNISLKRFGLVKHGPVLSTEFFRAKSASQLSLFD